MSQADSNSHGPVHSPATSFMSAEERKVFDENIMVMDKQALFDSPCTKHIHIETPKKCYHVRENGAIKTWKSNPLRFRLPVIYGLGPSGGYITEEGASYPYFNIYNARWHFELDCTRNH